MHPTNPSLTIAFHSSWWLIPASTIDMPAAVSLFLRQADARPDPGSAASKEHLLRTGWTESAVTLRMLTGMCLYKASSTADRARLLPALEALIGANTDPARYYGPPMNRAHNHGLMADRALLDMSDMLDRPALARIAVQRLTLQAEQLYDSCGMTREQASSYQYVHARLWPQFPKRIDNASARKRFEALSSKLARAASRITFPDGIAPVIGDGQQKVVGVSASVTADVDLWCPETGWFSWRRTSDGVGQQVIARFGPGTTFHGHSDKGSVVWWVGSGPQGHQVLTDRGLPGKDRDAAYRQAVGPRAHSVLLWPGGSDSLSVAQRTASGLRMTVGRNPRQGQWERSVEMSAGRPVLRIEDVVTGPSSRRPATTNLPLDPRWVPTRTPGIFRSSDTGSTLSITCRTAGGASIRPATDATWDYQLSTPRPATNVTCGVDEGRDGIVVVLRVRL